jgi:hypothetical protein
LTIHRLHICNIIISAMVLAIGPCAAESVGIPACDQLLKRYETCLGSTIPPEEWPDFKRTFDERVKEYGTFYVKDTKAKATVQAACKRHQETTKDLGGNTDCTISPFLVFDSPFLQEPKTP